MSEVYGQHVSLEWESGEGPSYDLQFVRLYDGGEHEHIRIPTGSGPVEFIGKGEPIDIAARVIYGCTTRDWSTGDDERGVPAVRRVLEALTAASPTPDKLALAVEALERIRDLGSDGEHSGDRHARCRDFARSALAAIKAAD